MAEQTDTERAFRTAVERALGARSASAVAREAGLPKDSVRDVLQGTSPRLGRADALCRALGLTFSLGAAAGEEADAPPSGASVRREAVGDVHLAELLSRLAHLWEVSDKADRARLALAVAGMLDLVHAPDGTARGRTVEMLTWRVDRPEMFAEPDGD